MSQTSNLVVLRNLVGLALPLTATVAYGSVGTFKVAKGDKQEASVESATVAETFVGRTHDVSGVFHFNSKTHKGSGKLMVDVASIDTAIPLRNQHLQSADWLDSAKYPTITFVSKAVKYLGQNQYKVKGAFSLHGVTRQISTVATIKFLKENSSTSTAGFSGDVTQVRTSFKLKLADYGIKIAGPAVGKVADTVTISIVAYGTTKA